MGKHSKQLACPHCGGRNGLVSHCDSAGARPGWRCTWVVCTECCTVFTLGIGGDPRYIRTGGTMAVCHVFNRHDHPVHDLAYSCWCDPGLGMEPSGTLVWHHQPRQIPWEWIRIHTTGF